MNIIEWLKVMLVGMVEGFTEWVAMSSAGEWIRVDGFF